MAKLAIWEMLSLTAWGQGEDGDGPRLGMIGERTRFGGVADFFAFETEERSKLFGHVIEVTTEKAALFLEGGSRKIP